MTGDPEDHSSGRKILLVEDDEDTCEALAQLLRRPGHEVITAYRVAEALRIAQAGGLDLIILDNWFKVGSGVELCRQIRKFDAETPILFYSAAAYDTDVKEGLRAGADGYIIKPDFEEFQQTLTRLLDTKRKR